MLFEYLKHGEPSVREGVGRALARYPQRADELVALLEEALKVESEDYVREAMDAAIAELRQHL